MTRGAGRPKGCGVTLDDMTFDEIAAESGADLRDVGVNAVSVSVGVRVGVLVGVGVKVGVEVGVLAAVTLRVAVSAASATTISTH